jgi:ABC-type polar amino acid transport system ATPase subunit
MGGKRILELKNVNKYYDNNHVLKDVNLIVEQGDVWAIIGPSGSGKSTMLYCINSLEPIQSGEIFFQGKKFSEYTKLEIHESIGIIFQNYNLFPHLTVLDNVTLAPYKVKKIPMNQCRKKAVELLEKVGLAHKKDAFPHELSGGQAQRIAIARSLAMEPKIMLYDEVTSALDPELVQDVLEAIRDLAREGMTSLIVTHEIPFARECTDYCLFMNDGKLEESGLTKEVLNNPKNVRTKEFLQKVL